MAQRIKLEDLDVVVISESRLHTVLELANRTQEVRMGDVRVLVVYPDGATVEEIERLTAAAVERARN